MASEPSYSPIAADDHKAYMEYALEQARLSPSAAAKFCVTAGERTCRSREDTCRAVLPHQSGSKHNLPEERIGDVLPKNTVLYTTMEPCNKRLSGNRTCVERILRLNGAIKVVYVGIKEPEIFVGESVAG